jgi:sugar phosphate isomerase/epimerase
VDYPALIAGLRAHNYPGALTIEREISGEQQLVDIRHGIEFLERIQ